MSNGAGLRQKPLAPRTVLLLWRHGRHHRRAQNCWRGLSGFDLFRITYGSAKKLNAGVGYFLESEDRRRQNLQDSDASNVWDIQPASPTWPCRMRRCWVARCVRLSCFRTGCLRIRVWPARTARSVTADHAARVVGQTQRVRTLQASQGANSQVVDCSGCFNASAATFRNRSTQLKLKSLKLFHHSFPCKQWARCRHRGM